MDLDLDSDPDLDADPDPAIFIIDLKDGNKKLIFNFFLHIILYHFSKIKGQKDVTKQ
jgi:hypothetical protein